MLTEKQIEERKFYIGGSDCAAVLGLSRWSSPLMVWMTKGENGKNEVKESVAMEVGTELEDLVARMFMKRTKKEVQRRNETIYDKTCKFLAVNIDRKVVGEDAILECKTAGAFKAKEWEGEDIPQEYILQVMHGLMVTGYKKGYIAVLIDNHDFKWKEILRDENLIKDIRAREIDFWQYVEKKQMPPFISYLDNEPLSAMFGKPENETIIQVDNKFNEKIECVIKLETLIDETEKEIDTIKNEIKALIGNNTGLKTDKYQYTWKLINKKEYTVAAKSYRELRKKRTRRGEMTWQT